MNEFEPLPAENAPVTPPVPPPPAKKESMWTRPLFLGQSLPWLAGGVLLLIATAWYLFWPSSSTPDAGALAFSQPAAITAPVPVSDPAPLQTGGLSVPASSLSAASGGSVPDDVVKLIREGHEFEAANREAINRLSDTVRAQTKALAALQQQLDGVTRDNERLANQLTVLAARPSPESPGRAAGKRAPRSALAGMRLESLQDGMAWVSWQGRTWAVQPGDSVGPVTVHGINLSDRSVTTSAGVLR